MNGAATEAALERERRAIKSLQGVQRGNLSARITCTAPRVGLLLPNRNTSNKSEESSNIKIT